MTEEAEAPFVEKATFGIGGFDAAKDAFSSLGGVQSWRVGYMGGQLDRPTPEQVATNQTGHAEVIELTFDTSAMLFRQLLVHFWAAHDPAAVPLDGCVEGHRFRSAIFFHSVEQESLARGWIADPGKVRSAAPPELVGLLHLDPGEAKTEILPATTFWPAEEDDQQPLHARSEARIARWEERNRRRAQRAEAGEPDELADVIEVFGDHVHVIGITWEIDEEHHEALFASFRRSIRSLGDRAVRLPTSTSLGAYSGEIRVRWSWPGVDHTLAIATRPGTFTERAVLDDVSARLGSVSQSGDELVMSGGGHSRERRDHRWLPRATIPPWRPAGVTSALVGHDGGADAPATWANTVPDALIQLDVGGSEPHKVLWSAGSLELLHHPSDIEREQTMTALGGRVCPCLVLHDLWHPHWLRHFWHMFPVSDRFQPRFALPVSADGWPNPPTTAAPWERRRTTSEYPELDRIPPIGPPDEPEWRPNLASLSGAERNVQSRILQLPVPLLQRWVLNGLHHLKALQRDGELPYLDQGNLSGLTLAPLRQAIAATLWRQARSDPSLTYAHIVGKVVDDDQPARAEAYFDDESSTLHMVVAIPLSWLSTVWLRGLSVVDGLLVLEVEGPSDAEELDAKVARWHRHGEGGPLRLVTRKAKLRWYRHQWHVTEDEAGAGRP